MNRVFKDALIFGLTTVFLFTVIGCGGGGGNSNGGHASGRVPDTVVSLNPDRNQLIAVADDGSIGSRILSGTPFTDISSFTLSPDGQFIAYIADETVAGLYELYVSPIDGTGSTLISKRLNAFSDVADFAWSPDSLSVAYRVDLALDDRLQLFRVDIDGSNLYEISNFQLIFDSAFVSELYGWSPDGSYLAYVVDDPTFVKFALFIHDAIAAVRDTSITYTVSDLRNKEIVAFKFSPDSQSLAFRSDDLLGSDQYEILVMPSDRSSVAVRANGGTGNTVQIGQFEWSPDSRFLGQSVIGYPDADRLVGINTYEVDTADSSRVINASDFGTIRWAKGSNRLAFVAFNGLYVHDADTPITTYISHTPAAGEIQMRNAFSWSPDDSLIAFITDTSGSDSLYIALSDGSAAPAQAGGTKGLSLGSLSWSGDSAWLGVLERDETSAFHPGNWYIYDAAAILSWESQNIFTFESSQVMKWSYDNVRAVYSMAGSSTLSDMLESVSVDSVNTSLFSGDVAAAPQFQYPAETWLTP